LENATMFSQAYRLAPLLEHAIIVPQRNAARLYARAHKSRRTDSLEWPFRPRAMGTAAPEPERGLSRALAS
jgi:hypothetical protein